jgi:hypothetical protein
VTATLRPIPWEALDASTLDAEARAAVGREWRERMRQEHLAVGAFALLTQEVAAEGCPPAILSLLARAASDEVRHAEICRQMAVALLGEHGVPAYYRGLPKVPRHEPSTAEERTLLHVVEMCCLSETLTGVYFTEMIARATHPTARAAIESLLEDEIDHGRVGWAYLAARKGDARLVTLAGALPSMLDRTAGRALRDFARRAEPDDPAREAFGHLGARAGATAVRRALRDVIVPGFEQLGVDLAPSRDGIAALLG